MRVATLVLTKLLTLPEGEALLLSNLVSDEPNLGVSCRCGGDGLPHGLLARASTQSNAGLSVKHESATNGKELPDRDMPDLQVWIWNRLSWRFDKAGPAFLTLKVALYCEPLSVSGKYPVAKDLRRRTFKIVRAELDLSYCYPRTMLSDKRL